jgi:hypothetical protein
MTKEVQTKNIPVYFMATAGMRLLEQQNPVQAKKIYQIIQQELSKEFNIKFLATISGREEGLYDWLMVNYLLNKFYDLDNSYLALDMGGASTQIAYFTKQPSKAPYNYFLKLDNIQANLFIHSFLGLGYKETIKNLKQLPACSNKFNIKQCKTKVKERIDSFNVKNIAGDLSQYNIVGFDNIYKLFKYFKISDARWPIKALEDAVQTQCVKQDSLQVEQRQQLQDHCVGGVYISTLLVYGYNLSENIDSSQLQILDVINNTSLDWSLGAGLYHGLAQ